jgi:hypothetical protein
MRSYNVGKGIGILAEHGVKMRGKAFQKIDSLKPFISTRAAGH